MAHPERPLSPFMLGQTYRWQITSALSLLHRATGIGLAIGAFGLAWWLLAVTASPERYAQFMDLAGSLPGKAVLAAFSWCLIYHLCNGIRHLAFDCVRGFEIKQFYASGWTVVALSFVLTAALWACVLTRGGLA